MNEKDQKSTSTAKAQKCLKENYQKLRVNVRSERLEEWKSYAEFKGMSMYALVHELFEKAMVNDGFKNPDQSKNNKAKK